MELEATGFVQAAGSGIVCKNRQNQGFDSGSAGIFDEVTQQAGSNLLPAQRLLYVNAPHLCHMSPGAAFEPDKAHEADNFFAGKGAHVPDVLVLKLGFDV